MSFDQGEKKYLKQALQLLYSYWLQKYWAAYRTQYSEERELASQGMAAAKRLMQDLCFDRPLKITQDEVGDLIMEGKL